MKQFKDITNNDTIWKLSYNDDEKPSDSNFEEITVTNAKVAKLKDGTTCLTLYHGKEVILELLDIEEEYICDAFHHEFLNVIYGTSKESTHAAYVNMIKDSIAAVEYRYKRETERYNNDINKLSKLI